MTTERSGGNYISEISIIKYTSAIIVGGASNAPGIKFVGYPHVPLLLLDQHHQTAFPPPCSIRIFGLSISTCEQAESLKTELFDI